MTSGLADDVKNLTTLELKMNHCLKFWLDIWTKSKYFVIRPTILLCKDKHSNIFSLRGHETLSSGLNGSWYAIVAIADVVYDSYWFVSALTFLWVCRIQSSAKSFWLMIVILMVVWCSIFHHLSVWQYLNSFSTVKNQEINLGQNYCWRKTFVQSVGYESFWLSREIEKDWLAIGNRARLYTRTGMNKNEDVN